MELNEKQWITSRDGDKYFSRRLVPADKDTLQQFGKSLSDASTAAFLPHAYDDETVDMFLKRSEAGNDLTLALFDEEKMIGYFFLWYFTSPVPLLGVSVLDEYQGKRLGREMMKLLIEAARQKGCDGIELTTLSSNHRAYALYESVGFRYYGDVNNIVGDGRIVTERAMFLQINPYAIPSTDLFRQPPIDLVS